MIIILGGIEGQTYEKFIKYLHSKCNKITFFLTDYMERWYPKDNMKRYTNMTFDQLYYPLYKKKTLEKYVSKIENRYPVILENCLKKYYDVYYLGAFSNIRKAIYEIDFTEAILKTLLLSNNDLYSFRFSNELPEDLCFYNNEKRLVTTIVHEGMCLINDDTIIHDLIEQKIFKESDFGVI